MARAVLRTLDGAMVEALRGSLVVEVPRVYQGSKQVGDPNDLIALAGVGGALAGRAAWAEVGYYYPYQWKGQVTKDAMGARILGALSGLERNRVHQFGGRQHNVTDAIGIGLHHLGRLRRARVLPGAARRDTVKQDGG